MRKTDQTRLIAAAIKARKRACAPYSNFKVGAALLTNKGKIISGANVESASYGLTCCAERIALFTALNRGETQFSAIAVVTRMKDGMPCGACRQLLSEYAGDAVVWIADTDEPQNVKEFSVKELLPGAFLQFSNPVA